MTISAGDGPDNTGGNRAVFYGLGTGGQERIEREIIAIDGKAVREHFKGGGKPCIWRARERRENRPVFGQVKTEEKSNEIMAIPALLEKPAPEGSIVTIDAMGCRHKIAGQVLEKKADYRETPYEDVREYFRDPDFSVPAGKNRDMEFQSVSTHDEKHGRGQRIGLLSGGFNAPCFAIFKRLLFRNFSF
jgi:hypothetical protein